MYRAKIESISTAIEPISFLTLPLDLHTHICAFLSGSDIVALGKVSTRMFILSGNRTSNWGSIDMQMYGKYHIDAYNMDQRLGTDVFREHSLPAHISGN